jgi:hypothetical protein
MLLAEPGVKRVSRISAWVPESIAALALDLDEAGVMMSGALPSANSWNFLFIADRST